MENWLEFKLLHGGTWQVSPSDVKQVEPMMWGNGSVIVQKNGARVCVALSTDDAWAAIIAARLKGGNHD